jgi:hypothetical protein
MKRVINNKQQDDMKEKDSIKKIVSHIRQYTKLRDGEFFFRRDLYSRRLHTNLTGLCKSMRPYLEVEGIEQLCIVDLSNSQPLLFNLVLKKLSCPFVGDVAHYLALCESGKFYDFLVERINEKFGKKFTRVELKTLFFSTVIFSNRICPWSQVLQVFEDCFPTVWSFVKDFIKGVPLPDDLEIGVVRKLNWELPELLQSIESEIFIDRISPELSKKGIWHGTIHDGILCDYECHRIVVELIESILSEYDTSPTCSVETLK